MKTAVHIVSNSYTLGRNKITGKQFLQLKKNRFSPNTFIVSSVGIMKNILSRLDVWVCSFCVHVCESFHCAIDVGDGISVIRMMIIMALTSMFIAIMTNFIAFRLFVSSVCVRGFVRWYHFALDLWPLTVFVLLRHIIIHTYVCIHVLHSTRVFMYLCMYACMWS